MPIEFRMPSLGPDMESGTLVEWRVKPGDTVKRGDVVALVETDKGVIDVEIFAEGMVEKLLVEAGATVPVDAALAVLSGDAQSALAAPVTPPAGSTRPESALAAKQPDVVATPSERMKISPAARAKARTLGINLESITGSGPGGVITLEDIEKRRPAGHASQGEGMREVIGRAMSRSKREIPHYYLGVTCSFLAARTWLDQYNAAIGVEGRVLPAALFVKAVASAARAMPDFNGFYRDEKLSVAVDVNVGMAIAMRGGRLVAPAILAADTKDLATIMRELRDLTTRVRAGHMRGSELSLPTITVTSLGDEGIDTVVPVIYPPQVAIVGFGSVVERPWITDGVIKPAPIVHIDLAADHRATDGRAGAQFLAHIRDALQAPERL